MWMSAVGPTPVASGALLRAGQMLAPGQSLAIAATDRDLLRLLTTSSPDEARTAWQTWKRAHPLDDASSSELRVVPAISERLRSLGIDDADSGRLRGVSRFQWLWTQRATRASSEAAAMLEQAGMQVVALKGLALHALGVASCAERPITDGDLLPSGDLAAACAVLGAYGWKVTRRQRHAWVCVRGPQEELDLHRYSLQQDPLSDAWTRSGAVRAEHATFATPAPAHLIVHACWHGVRGAGSLLWALDVMRLIQRTHVDWQELIRVARERCFALILMDALGVVAREVPAEVLSALAEQPVSPLEALEYAHCAGCPGPWAASARRASLALRELRTRGERLDEGLLTEEARRIRVQWDPTWPARWQRPERNPTAS